MPVFDGLARLFRPSALAASAPVSEAGFQRLGGKGGSVADEVEEIQSELEWPESIAIFDKMRRDDPQVASVLKAVTLPIRRATWSIDPAGAPDEVVAHVATNLGLPVKGRDDDYATRLRDRFSFEEHLRLALLELVHGHSVFEQVYRLGDDGLLHIRKLAWRPARSIEKFDVARDGGLVAIVQKSDEGEVTIPVERLVVYVNEREGAAWQGNSLLRPAYKNWILKDRALRTQAETLDRNGMGVPVYKGAKAPETVENSPSDLDAWQQSESEAGLNIAKGFRSGKTAGASIPNSADLELKGVSGQLPDADVPIRYHDEQIARAVLAHFLNLGTETGSWALGSTFADFFTGALNAFASHIADVAQQHIIEDLVDLNFGPDVAAPRLVCAAIGEEQAATAEAISSLIACGALEPDEQLEAFVRARYKLPNKDKDTVRVSGGGDAEKVRAIAEVAQKAYLGVDKLYTSAEGRALLRQAGAELEPGDLVVPAAMSEEAEGVA